MSLQFTSALLVLIAFAPLAHASGKTVFTEYRCNSCHSITAEGVAQNGKKDDAAADLSGIGKKHNTSWFERYLLKKEEIDGKKHKKKFRGEATELKSLTEWLASLKTEAKTAK